MFAYGSAILFNKKLELCPYVYVIFTPFVLIFGCFADLFTFDYFQIREVSVCHFYLICKAKHHSHYFDHEHDSILHEGLFILIH